MCKEHKCKYAHVYRPQTSIKHINTVARQFFFALLRHDDVTEVLLAENRIFVLRENIIIVTVTHPLHEHPLGMQMNVQEVYNQGPSAP